MQARSLTGLALLAALSMTSCQSAYYATMEKFGVHKREILVDRVEAARTEQEGAQEQFQTTFEAFQALTNFDGGELESLYNKLNSEYEDSVESADAVRQRVQSIEDVSVAMFTEWDREIAEITDAGLAGKSRTLRNDTEMRYNQLIKTMHESSSRMDPVLETFKNNVLFLKHNLNAQAISSLKDTGFEIEEQVGSLIAKMQESIQEANDFIDSMGT